MAKITIDNLVNLIMEEITSSASPIFFRNFQDVVNYYDLDNLDNNEFSQEMGEMANISREARMQNKEILTEPIRIPVQDLINGGGKPIPKIISKDPETGEFVEDVVIGNEVFTLPIGGQILKFHNWGVTGNLDRKNVMAHFVKIPENIHYPNFPRKKEYGTGYVKTDKGVEKPNETELEREKREKYIKTQNEGYVKRHVIFRGINELFTRPDILNRLDMCLVPEVRGTTLRTERTTNVEKRMEFGGNSPTINIEFHSVMDQETLEHAIDRIFDVRANVEDEIERERTISVPKPREYSNYIYRGGKWEPSQRILDKDAFIAAGEYTPILKLLKKNIQKGEKRVNVMSKLYIDGDVVDGNQYKLRAKFTTILNHREENKTTITTSKYIPDIFAEVTRPLPEDIEPEQFTIRNNIEFFGTKAGGGIFFELMDKLGEKILQTLDPDDAIDTLTKILVPSALDIDALQ